VIHVVTAVITAKGECEMTTTITEKNETAQAPATDEQSKPNRKARVAPRRAHVAKAQAKSARKASPVKKAPKGGKKAVAAREGSKTARIVDQLNRSGGATLKDLMKATGWQPHSVRGFLSILGKKKGLAVESTKSPDSERTYSIKG
jgi:hypothetical protein